MSWSSIGTTSVFTGQMTEAELDVLNAQLLVGLQESGVAVPSNARIRNRFAIRVAHTNHRTVRSDFDVLINTVLQLGRRLSGNSVHTFK